MTLADNLGIHKNTTDKLMTKMVHYKDEFIHEVSDSFLTNEMKSGLANLISTRVDTLAPTVF